MFLLVCVPFAFGYLIAVRMLREKQIAMRLVLSYTLGLFSYLFWVNIFFYFLPLKTSVCVTLGLMAISSPFMFLVKPVQGRIGNVETKEVFGLGFFCLTAFLVTLLWQMGYFDDDFFIHAPLMGLYLKDNFPPSNPFFPELAYRGHYGRDLCIASLSILFGGRFLLVQYLITAVNQVAIILLGYLTAKRYLRSSGQATIVMLCAFLAVNGTKTGLLEVFWNNNSFVYLLLFLNVYLYFRSLVRRDIASKIVCIPAFAVYGIVYETHYAILLLTVGVFPFVLCILRGRWRLRYFSIAGSIGTLSLLIVLIQGGAPTDIAKRLILRSTTQHIVNDDIRGASQEVEMKFPKRGLQITSWRGNEYPLFSKQLIEEAGLFVFFLPLTAALMMVAKKYWGILFGLVSLFAILAPATIDFGRFNSESLRFLFLGGLGAAMLFGIAMAITYEAALKGRLNRKLAYFVIGCLMIASFEQSVEKAAKLFSEAARYPERFYWNPEDWASAQSRGISFSPLDRAVATKIRPLMKKGDVILTNLYSQSDGATLRGNALISALSGAYVTGMGLWNKSSYDMGNRYIKQLGFRAMAFWNTLDLELLRDLKAKYLYINPDDMSRELYKKLGEEPALELAYRASDPGSLNSREVYRIKESEPATSYSLPGDFHLRSVGLPEEFQAQRFYRIPIVFGCGDRAFDGKVKVFYRILYRGKIVNLGDEIRQMLRLEKMDNHGYKGELYFVAPYEEGDYEVEFYVWDINRFRPLLDEGNNKAVLGIHVI